MMAQQCLILTAIFGGIADKVCVRVYVYTSSH
jgi:hypothetical protein